MPDSETALNLLPLVKYQGEKPPAPDWFQEAVATPYRSEAVEVDGTAIRYQCWGDPAKPGLLLVHGNAAHAHWYDFIAPSFIDTHYVVAMNTGGMGDSDHHDSYSPELFAREQVAVAEHAGLFVHAIKPIVAAHSFGGLTALWMASRFGDQFGGLIVIDTHVRPPGEPRLGPPDMNRPHRIYPTLTAALGRFRLAPAQPCENDYLVDHVARHSLKQVQLEDGHEGWTWKFDNKIWRRFEAEGEFFDMLRNCKCRLALMRGRDSVLVLDDAWEHMRSVRPDIPMVSVENAQHHVLLDQPLGFIAALKSLLKDWD